MKDNFLRNAWYMAGWAQDLDAGVISRRITDMPIVVVRGPGGDVYALHDRCPHRFAPLSKGTVNELGVQCGYHGLTFDATGKCVANPLSGVTPSACKVRSFPVVVQDRCVWVWMGPENAANPEDIPRFPCFADPQYRFVYGAIQANADYQMLTDNLLDLTHAAFLHPSFGGLAYRPKVSMDRQGDTVYSKYIVTNIPNPEFPEVFWPAHGKNVDIWDDIRWNVPAALYLESGVVLTGRPRTEGYLIPAVHVLTPAGAGKTTYFWASSMPCDAKIPDEEFKAIMSNAFENEDLPMIEAAWNRMEGEELFDLGPVMLKEDAATVIARRILKGRIESEQAAESVSR